MIFSWCVNSESEVSDDSEGSIIGWSAQDKDNPKRKVQATTGGERVLEVQMNVDRTEERISGGSGMSKSKHGKERSTVHTTIKI